MGIEDACLLTERMEERQGGSAQHGTGYRKLALRRELWTSETVVGVESNRQSKSPRLTQIPRGMRTVAR